MLQNHPQETCWLVSEFLVPEFGGCPALGVDEARFSGLAHVFLGRRAFVRFCLGFSLFGAAPPQWMVNTNCHHSAATINMWVVRGEVGWLQGWSFWCSFCQAFDAGVDWFGG